MRKYMLLLAAAALMAAPRAAHAGYTATLAPTVASTPDSVSGSAANGIADIGETFTVAGGGFSNFVSDNGWNDPQLNAGDLGNYSYNLNGAVASITGGVVTYKGTYSINYAGFGGNPVSAGDFTIDAIFSSQTFATLSGTLVQTSSSGAPFGDLGAYSLVTFSGTFAPDANNSAGSQSNTGILNGTITAHGGAIPEPGSMALLATGLLPMAGMLRRRRKA